MGYSQTRSLAFILGTAAILPSFAHAQWSVTILHPAGTTRSFLEASTGTQHAGSVVASGVTRAALWNGTSNTRVDLHPASATESYANAAS